uniref:F-box protein At2g27310 n=1 Tax=Anthurium amnicola TaxID=1678845 RepID=A0A1D1YNT8_9ARAE
MEEQYFLGESLPGRFHSCTQQALLHGIPPLVVFSPTARPYILKKEENYSRPTPTRNNNNISLMSQSERGGVTVGGGAAPSMAAHSLTGLSTDLLVEILSRVDAPTLASAACVSVDLHRAAEEDALWEELCHRTWPSTTGSSARELLSSMPGGYAKFYADSLPLLLYKPRRRGCSLRHDPTGTGLVVNSCDLVSFVDVYYREGCVLSRVIHATPLHGCSGTAAFLDCPLIKLEALAADGTGPMGSTPPSMALEPKEEGGVGVLNWGLEEDLRLSWVVLDARGGRAVNVSSGSPTAVQRDTPSKGDLVARFGCAVPAVCGVGDECVVITLRCLLSEAEDRVAFAGVELRVEDGEGACVGWRRSWAVLEMALSCRARTRSGRAAAEGYRAYVRGRRERKMMQGSVPAEKLCALSSLLLFLVGLLLMFLS